MKLITAIVRLERLAEVKSALFKAGVTGMTLERVGSDIGTLLGRRATVGQGVVLPVAQMRATPR